ncbi:hypothetical protein IscW_ISCW021248 [Ixodes scapularis]|uniref:Ig-like domain-containing protein n=1 Tax=Ixodes scapularis TaxID=6945 RepID=B7Q6H1_IXOSC|nr:hypothetical protein IscW_ISCW021248 [Ixodes scapularis]|eukprot:XP_002403023.1 hypothetical protein IscW_ISCW021248 [Ixodes scapularis]
MSLLKGVCHPLSTGIKKRPCPEHVDFRATQCSEFDQVPYRGRLYEWTPVHDASDPCSLTCQAREFKFMAKLAPRAQDGTRCRQGSLDMCVQGKCLPVGCDLELGSYLEVDECGICGGNGTSCRAPAFTWSETPFSECSVTCGGGFQESHPVCTSSDTGSEVDDRLCNVDERPDSRVRKCNGNPCPPGWQMGAWGDCSASCGGGQQVRNVSCVRPTVPPVPVAEHFCPGQRPATSQSCNLHDCSRWTEGQWSQTRAVECRDLRGRKSHLCDPKRQASVQATVLRGKPLLLKGKEYGSQEDAPPQSFPPFNIFSKPQNQSPGSEPSFIVGDWGSCSVTCGDGVQKRAVECKIFLEFSRTMAKLPDKECTGIRPAELQRCTMRPCAMDQNREALTEEEPTDQGVVTTYSWRSAGYTPCTASCLGGIRESLVHCVRNEDGVPVSYIQCDIRDKPETITQTCNNRPCPPRWNTSDFTACSKPCGGGSQTRTVQCVHEVTRGVGNTLVVPDTHCPLPRPAEHRMCNMVDCVAHWTADSRAKWLKDGLPVKTSSRRVVVSRKGGLRIRKADFPDAGTYVCSAGTSKSELLDRATSSDVDRTAFKVDLASDQERNDQGLREVKGTLEDPTVNSGASSRPGGNIPRIQTLLSDFHRRLGGSGAVRGTVELPPDDEDQLGVPNSYVLGRGNADNLQFEWSTTPWSACSQTCGGSGLQVRSTQCMVRLHNVSRTVDSTLCAGLEAPQILQRCGSAGCPLWVTGSWSQCSDGRCFTLSTSVQERLVECRLPDGTPVDEKLCDASTRPQDQQECLSERCRGVWKVGDWSECTATCGESGFRTRILRCVWYGTDKPAGDSCRNQDRPEVLQGCDAPPCNATSE